jgi:hypothetical protein
LDSFSGEGFDNKKYYLLVLPAPILSLVSYLVVKNMIKAKFSDPGYRKVLKYYLLGQIDSVKGHLHLQNLIERRNLRRQRFRQMRRNLANASREPTPVLVKKEQGAIDRMAGLFMKGPSLFSRTDVANSELNKVTPANLENGAKKEDDEPEICIICFDPEHKPNTFYAPCSHAGVCRECALNIVKTKKSCPICRQDITSLIFYEKTKEGKYAEVESLEFNRNNLP